jgi:hypothetical protein
MPLIFVFIFSTQTSSSAPPAWRKLLPSHPAPTELPAVLPAVLSATARLCWPLTCGPGALQDRHACALWHPEYHSPAQHVQAGVVAGLSCGGLHACPQPPTAGSLPFPSLTELGRHTTRCALSSTVTRVCADDLWQAVWLSLPWMWVVLLLHHLPVAVLQYHCGTVLYSSALAVLYTTALACAESCCRCMCLAA